MHKLYFLFIAVVLVSCSTPPKIVRNQNIGGALGTSYSIIYLSDAELDFQQEIDSIFKVVNASLSTYILDSDISKINAGDSTVVIDHMFQEVFALTKDIHTKTNGYFDPTVGVLVNAWGFGPGEALDMNQKRIDSLLDFVGFDKVRLLPGNTIHKLHPDIYFDFNAIAKGYAIDRLAVMLDEKGITDYLIEVGGELIGKGQNHIKEKPWLVGIDDPQMKTKRTLKKTIYLQDRALASSGNYRKFRVDTLTGKKYVHTIDPKTGYTKNTNVLGVTILAEDCATADGYATAFMAMDLDESIKILVREKGLDAYIIYLDQQGETKEFITNGFKEQIVGN